MSNLVNHAKEELSRANLFDDTGDFYGGMLGEAVLELIEVFAKQGHSGMSGSICLQMFNELVDFRPITPVTDDPVDWQECGPGLWQCRRKSDAFSLDGGKTYYVLGEQRNWLKKLPWPIYKRLPQYAKYPKHTSQAAEA